MKINTIVNFGFVFGIVSSVALAACQGPDGPHATDDTSDAAGGSAGSGGDAGSAGSAGTAGSGDTGGTDGGVKPPLCTPGAQQQCECSNGDDGFQVCGADGTWSTCKATTNGTGGTSGSGGSAGTSGSGGTPSCVPGDVKDCHCSNGFDGDQTCAEDGKSYGLCVHCDDGTGGTGGSAGSGGTGSDMVDVEFSFTVPSNAPAVKGVVLWGITHDGGTWGSWSSLCDSNSSDRFERNGNTYTCTETFPAGITLDFNVEVNAEAGTSFPSNTGEQYACYGFGTSCDDESCFRAYGTVKVDGDTLTVPADAVGNAGQHGCNFRIGIE